jgi:hypothetical protein
MIDKRYHRHAKRLLPLCFTAAIAAALVASCVSTECYDNQNSLPLAGFYSSYGDGEPSHSVTIDSVSIYGIGASTILEDSVVALSQVYLPFRVEEEVTQYVFEYLPERFHGMKDTITFRYKEVPYFVSAACGAIYKYEIQEINTTGRVIDSVTCPNGVIDNIAEENIRIYLNDNTVEARP